MQGKNFPLRCVYSERCTYLFLLRVLAAFRAALRSPAFPLVRTAFLAAALRDDAPRRRALPFACRASERCDAAERPSRRSARFTPRERVRDGRRRERDFPRAVSCAAFSRVSAEVDPFLGAGSFTPARRAFDSPIAIACCGDRAPCLPSRTWWISSRTNSPAWVLGDLPSRASSCALSIVSFSGMTTSLLHPSNPLWRSPSSRCCSGTFEFHYAPRTSPAAT